MKKIISLVLISSLAFTFCRRDPEVGPTGPRGPRGPAGEDGSGAIVSNVYTVNESDWEYDDPSYFADIAIPDLTSDIVNNGIVLAYLKVDDNTFSQLPLTFYESDEYSSTLEVISFPELVSIVWTDSDLLDGGNPPTMEFRVVYMHNSTGKKAFENSHSEPDTLFVKDYPEFFRNR